MSPLLKFALDALDNLFDETKKSPEEEKREAERTLKLYQLVKHRLSPPPTRH